MGHYNLFVAKCHVVQNMLSYNTLRGVSINFNGGGSITKPQITNVLALSTKAVHRKIPLNLKALITSIPYMINLKEFIQNFLFKKRRKILKFSNSCLFWIKIKDELFWRACWVSFWRQKNVPYCILTCINVVYLNTIINF